MQAERAVIDQAEAVVEAPSSKDMQQFSWQCSPRKLAIAIMLLCPILAALGGSFGSVAQAVVWCAAFVLAILAGYGALTIALLPMMRSMDWMMLTAERAIVAARKHPKNPVEHPLNTDRSSREPSVAERAAGTEKRPLQFSLRGLFGATTLIALMLGAAVGSFGEAAQSLTGFALGMFLFSGLAALCLFVVSLLTFLVVIVLAFLAASGMRLVDATVRLAFWRGRGQASDSKVNDSCTPSIK